MTMVPFAAGRQRNYNEPHLRMRPMHCDTTILDLKFLNELVGSNEFILPPRLGLQLVTQHNKNITVTVTKSECHQ